MSMAGMMPSYDSPTKPATTSTNPRAFQPGHLDLTMPLFPSPGVGSAPFNPSVYGFDAMAVNPYNTQQPFNMTYPSAMGHSATYSGTTEISSSLVNPNEARDTFAVLNRSPTIKAEAHSPVHPSQIFAEPSFIEDCKGMSAGETEPAFSTDVDTLMKAIQAKSKPTRSPEQVAKVLLSWARSLDTRSLTRTQPEAVMLEPPRSNKPRKRHQCGIPNCSKSFYQKTHLDIHTRAHTGVKPFVGSKNKRLNRDLLMRP